MTSFSLHALFEDPSPNTAISLGPGGVKQFNIRIWDEADGKKEKKNLPEMAGDAGFHPLLGKTPWRRKWQPTPAFLPGVSHGQRSLVGLQSRGSQRVRHD